MRFYDFLVEKAKEDGIQKLVVGGIIMNEDYQILILTRRKEDFMGGIEEFPSGTVEAGETLYDALAREIKEETNLVLKKITSYINSFDYFSSSGRKVRQLNFTVEVDDCEDIFISEHEAYNWLTINECRNNTKLTSQSKCTIEIFNFNKSQEEK